MSQNPQAARTRGLIRRAFMDLVDEKGFTEVTVSDIATRAMINRTTFYRYFRDKHHLAEQIFTEIAAEMPLGTGPADKDPAVRMRSWARLFERFDAHAKLFGPLLGREGDPAFAARVRELCAEAARRRLRAATRTGGHDPAGPGPCGVPEDLALAVAANQIVATLSWWLEDGRRRTPEQMADTVVEFFSHGCLRALGLQDPPYEGRAPAGALPGTAGGRGGGGEP